MRNGTDFDVLLFDLGGVLIDFAGFEEMRHLLPEGLDRSGIRDRWIHSESVQLFERGDIKPEEFARRLIGEFHLELSAEEFLQEFVSWARGPYPGALALLRRRPLRLLLRQRRLVVRAPRAAPSAAVAAAAGHTCNGQQRQSQQQRRR